MTPQWFGHGRWSTDNTLYLHLQKTYRHQTRRGPDSEKLPSLKPYDPLITWHKLGHVAIWKIYISIIKRLTRLMTSKNVTVLTYGRKFSTQTLESSSTSCLFCFAPFFTVFCHTYLECIQEPYQLSKMELFAKIVHGWKLIWKKPHLMFDIFWIPFVSQRSWSPGLKR